MAGQRDHFMPPGAISGVAHENDAVGAANVLAAGEAPAGRARNRVCALSIVRCAFVRDKVARAADVSSPARCRECSMRHVRRRAKPGAAAEAAEAAAVERRAGAPPAHSLVGHPPSCSASLQLVEGEQQALH